MVVIVHVSGCNLPGHRNDPADLPETANAATAKLPPALAQAAWVVRVESPQGKPDDAQPTWRHAELENLLKTPADRRPGFARWVDDANPVVAANAAIALVRLQAGDPIERLAATVRNPLSQVAPEHRTALRRAAIEALGSIDSDAAQQTVKQLFDEFASTQSELHVELLRASRHQPPQARLAQLQQAITADSAEVRLTALQNWPAVNAGSLPEGFLALASDPDARVRAAALDVLVRQRHPEALASCSRATRDSDFQVRLAAIDGLGTLGDQASKTILRERLAEKLPPKIRGRIVAALATLGAHEELAKAAQDDAWQVRLAVAESVGEMSAQADAKLVAGLLDDSNRQVSQAMLQTVREWPLEQAGPPLLQALESEQEPVRKTIISELSTRWQPARQFSPVANQAARQQVLARLHKQWREDFSQPASAVGKQATASAQPTGQPFKAGMLDNVRHYLKTAASPHASEELQRKYRAALLEMGPELMEVLEQEVRVRKQPLPKAVYTEVLPELSPVFAQVVQLSSDDVLVRREAADALAQQAQSGRLPVLAIERLAEVVIPETDPLVWRSVLTAIDSSDDLAARRLATAGLSHEASDVRRRSCVYLEHHPDPLAADALLGALTDADASVVLAALQAIGQYESLEHQLPIVRLLTSRDKMLRIAAGTTLVRLGNAEGHDALERAAQDEDARVRRLAVEAMGQTGDAHFIPVLMERLNDQLGVQRSALASLAQVHGADIGAGEDGESANLAQQIRRWRKWHLLQSVPAFNEPK